MYTNDTDLHIYIYTYTHKKYHFSLIIIIKKKTPLKETKSKNFNQTLSNASLSFEEMKSYRIEGVR